MEKALKMGKTSATGSFQLLIGVVGSTLIMAVGTIVITRLLSPSDYGLYTIAMVPSIMVALFRDWGVNSATTKNIARLRVEGKDEEIHSVIVAGLIFEIVMGLALTFVSLLLASFVASVIFHRPASLSPISIMSATIFSGAFLAVAQSSFVGFERMKLNSLTLICQALVKTAIGPILVIFGYGVLGAVLGYTLSFFIAGIIGLSILYFLLFRPLRKSAINRSKISKTLKAMLGYGVPYSMAAILTGVLQQFYSFMMAAYSTNDIAGNYQVALNFSLLLSFVSLPISTVLFPTFAKLDPKNDRELLKSVFTSSIKYTGILLVPATLAVMALSGPMIHTLYGEQYVYAPFFLILQVLFNLLSMVGYFSLSSFLAGTGETKVLMVQSILGLVTGVPIAFLIVPLYGIVGVIMGYLFASLPGLFWGLYWVWRHYQVRAEVTSSIKILAASSVAAFAAYFSVNFLHIAEWGKLAIGVPVCLITYVLTAPLIKAVVRSDIENLRIMISGLGVISKIFDVPLRVAEKVANVYPAEKTDTITEPTYVGTLPETRSE